MVGREITEASASSVVLAGTLREAIVGHMKERARHFFLYMYHFRILMHLLQLPHSEWEAQVSVTATHQIDQGLRRDEGWDAVFKDDDTSVLDLSATAFRRMDAAHYCNLGIGPHLGGLVTACADPRAASIYEGLKSICGNTRQMPQRINIGPDRVVDRVHGELCLELLPKIASGAAPVSPEFFAIYKMLVVLSMRDYAEGQARNGNDAVAEASDIYIATLKEDVPPTELRTQGKASRRVKLRSTHSVEVWNTLVGNAQSSHIDYGFRNDPAFPLSSLMTRAVA